MILRGKWLIPLIGMSMLTACGRDDSEKTVNLTDFERIAHAAAKAEDRVTVQQLAEWIVESRQDYQLVDIRDEAAYESGHIKGAVSKPMPSLASRENLKELSHEQKIIVYSNGSENAAKAVVMLRLLDVDSYLLSGGYNAWQQHVLNPDIPAEASDDEAPEIAMQRAISCYFSATPGSGVNQVQVKTQRRERKRGFTPPVTTPPAAPGGLLQDEGC